MLLFSTILDINPHMTKEDFVRLLIEWNQSSLYHANIIPDMEWDGNYPSHFGNENLWLEIGEYQNENILFSRFEKKEEDGIIWDTDYIMNFNTMKLSIRLDRSFLVDALSLEEDFSTPYFISLLIKKGYVKDDKDLPIQYHPLMVNTHNQNILTDLIAGKSQYKLPVVYVTKTFLEKDYPFNIKTLASRLKGAAHVLAQDFNDPDLIIEDEYETENDGAVGIYFPNKTMGHRKYPYRSYTGSSKIFMEKIIHAVIQYHCTITVDRLYTWQGVNNALLIDRLSSQRKGHEESLKELLSLEQANKETEELLTSVDIELQDYQEEIRKLTRENEKLQQENFGLKMKLDENLKRPCIYFGDETDFYHGEIKDFVLSSLKDALKNVEDKSRRADVLNDILEHNDYLALSSKKAEQLKTILKTYDGLNAKTRQELMDLGFEITEEGKHYKLTYYGDGRYTTVYAKTPSDNRAGKNNSSTTIKKVY